jgi:hypothetical protein
MQPSPHQLGQIGARESSERRDPLSHRTLGPPGTSTADRLPRSPDASRWPPLHVKPLRRWPKLPRAVPTEPDESPPPRTRDSQRRLAKVAVQPVDRRALMAPRVNSPVDAGIPEAKSRCSVATACEPSLRMKAFIPCRKLTSSSSSTSLFSGSRRFDWRRPIFLAIKASPPR